VARGGVVAIFQDGLQDLLGEADALDGALPRDGLSVRGNVHTVVGIAEHTVDVKNHVSDVLLALAVVGHEELVRGVDGEVLRRQSGGGRHCSGRGAFLLGGLLCCWKRLDELGRHGGEVVVVGGSVVGGGGGGDGVGIIVVDPLFIAGEFLV
jgi:hypothetical protein